METVNVHCGRNVSHSELKEWIQKCLFPDMKEIGELGTGIVFCLGTFILFPDTISLKKVRVGGLSQYDKYHNFKCLQAAFNDLDLNKVIPMIDMMKMTFRDNFYFGCWFKSFFEANYDGQPYDMKTLLLQCNKKHTSVICNCFVAYSKKKSALPVKFKVRVKTSMFRHLPNLSKPYPNNEFSLKLPPGADFAGQTKRRRIVDMTYQNCERRGSVRRASSLNRQERPIIPEGTKIHQLRLPCLRSKNSKSLKEILACKSDSDFASKNRKYPPLTGGCVNQTDLCRSLNEAMAQIRKALITVRAGLYLKVAEDLDNRQKVQWEA